MIQLQSVKIGLIAFGGARGKNQILLEFEETNDEAKQLKYSTFKEFMDKEHPKEWNDFLYYSALKYQLWFKGGDALDSKENDAQLATFIDDLSLDSTRLQEGIPKQKRMVPFLVWFGTPTHIRGLRTVRIHVQGLVDIVENHLYYQAYFQYQFGLIDKDTPDLPLHELCNHEFCRVIIKAKTVDDLLFLKGKQLNPYNIEIVDDNIIPSADLQLFCRKKFFAYNYTPKEVTENFVII